MFRDLRRHCGGGETINQFRKKFQLESIQIASLSSSQTTHQKISPSICQYLDESGNEPFSTASTDDDEYEPEVQAIEKINPSEETLKQTSKRQRSSNNSNVKTDDEKLFTFKCHICEVPEFIKMHELSSHCRALHSCLPQVKCYCGKNLSTWRRLLIHKAKHFPSETDIRCSERGCNRTFRTQQGRSAHFEKAHGEMKTTFMCTRKMFSNKMKSFK